MQVLMSLKEMKKLKTSNYSLNFGPDLPYGLSLQTDDHKFKSQRQHEREWVITRQLSHQKSEMKESVEQQQTNAITEPSHQMMLESIKLVRTESQESVQAEAMCQVVQIQVENSSLMQLEEDNKDQAIVQENEGIFIFYPRSRRRRIY